MWVSHLQKAVAVRFLVLASANNKTATAVVRKKMQQRSNALAAKTNVNALTIVLAKNAKNHYLNMMKNATTTVIVQKTVNVNLSYLS